MYLRKKEKGNLNFYLPIQSSYSNKNNNAYRAAIVGKYIIEHV